MLNKKTVISILIIYTIIMFPISRYFDWDSMIVSFPTLYIAILLSRPLRLKNFIYDGLVAAGIGLMYLCFIKNMDTVAYIIIAILVGGIFVWTGVKLYKKYYYGIDPFDK